MTHVVKIGTRESELAVWQAKKVQSLLAAQQVSSELIFIKSEGDINLTVPLYELGVQGIFTKTLDIALLEKRIDMAVHSYKDVPTQPAKGIVKAAVLKRDAYNDILVYKGDAAALKEALGYVNGKWETPPLASEILVATSSIRRKAQWLNRYPNHRLDNLRGNVNSRLRKLSESNWHGAIFAAAGLERINIRPDTSIDLDWMLPAPAQGAISVVCREGDTYLLDVCKNLNDTDTELCTQAERDFLRALSGGCSTPISALAQIQNGAVYFRGSIVSVDGKDKIDTECTVPLQEVHTVGRTAGDTILHKGGATIIESIRNGGK